MYWLGLLLDHPIGSKTRTLTVRGSVQMVCGPAPVALDPSARPAVMLKVETENALMCCLRLRPKLAAAGASGPAASAQDGSNAVFVPSTLPGQTELQVMHPTNQ